MIIKAHFKSLSNPTGETGLLPTICIAEEDGTELVTDAAMTEIAYGWYYYNFSTYSSLKRYVWVIDGTDSLSNLIRYQHGCTTNESVLNDALDTAIEGFTLVETLRLVLSVLSGVSTGGGTNQVSFRDVANTKNRVQAIVDLYGNRSSVTLDAS